MELLPHNASDADLIAFADRWAMLMESEDYATAFAFTEQDPHMKWTPVLLGEVVKAYGDASPSQKVTLHGKPTDIMQRKRVYRWQRNACDAVGQIWYDLNIDGFPSDLTATFTIIQRPNGLAVELDDIHIM
jgi:hypothetical protein